MSRTSLPAALLSLLLIACGGASSNMPTSSSDRACQRIEGEPDGFGGEIRGVKIWDALAGQESGQASIELRDVSGETELRVGLWSDAFTAFVAPDARSITIAEGEDIELPVGTLIEIRLSPDRILSFTTESDATSTVTSEIWMGHRSGLVVSVPIADGELAAMGSSDWLGLRITPPGDPSFSMAIIQSDSNEMIIAARCFALAD